MARVVCLLGVVCTALVSQPRAARRRDLKALDKAIDIAQPSIVVDDDDVHRLAARLRAGEVIDFLKEPDNVRAIFDDVVSLAAKTKQPHGRTKDEARKLLGELGYDADETNARELLVKAGVWTQHENLDVIRRGVAIAFDDFIKAEAQKCLESPCADADAELRVDLTHLKAFAVDDASALEIDDALSVDGDMVWVHVADPTRWIQCGSPLDREARKRGASVYLPTGAVPMFPPKAVELFSLDGDDRRETCAISVGCVIGEQGEIVGDPIVTTSRVAVPRRLTYDAVDALLKESDDDAPDDATSTFRHLDEALARRREWRKRQGSLESQISAQMPQMSVDVDSTFKVAVSVAHQTPSRIVVQEAMLLFAYCVSAVAKRKRVPMPFRAQAAVPHSELAGRLERIPEGLARTWYAVRLLLRSGDRIPEPVAA
jgi:exoribonuclease-2